MKLIELYGIKIKELTEILKDERVRKFEIKEFYKLHRLFHYIV